jgi:hypothetical protein
MLLIPYGDATDGQTHPTLCLSPLASVSVTQFGAKADKVDKDDSFRGLTVFNGVVYFTQGSGSNRVNTVYFVDTTGMACPSGGVGVPVAGAKLPTNPLAYDPSMAAASGLPSNVCVLAGFPATPNKSAKHAGLSVRLVVLIAAWQGGNMAGTACYPSCSVHHGLPSRFDTIEFSTSCSAVEPKRRSLRLVSTSIAPVLWTS